MENAVIDKNPVATAEPSVTKMCYSIAEIELLLGVSRPSVIKLLKQNEFKWFKVGTVYRISKPSFDEWLLNTV